MVSSKFDKLGAGLFISSSQVVLDVHRRMIMKYIHCQHPEFLSVFVSSLHRKARFPHKCGLHFFISVPCNICQVGRPTADVFNGLPVARTP